MNTPAKIGPPMWLLAEVTYRCPLHCVFCYNPVDFAKHEVELSTEDWLRVLREGRELGAVQCGFSGGEPLLRDDLEILIGEARQLGYYTNLITSGVGLTEARLDAFKAAGLDHIQLSFQDSTKEVNDFLTHTRTFDLKQKVGEMIRARGWPMVMNVVIHRLNIEHIGRIIEMADALGAEYLELANAQYYSWALLNRDQLMPSREQLRRGDHQRMEGQTGRPHAHPLRGARLPRRQAEKMHERLGQHFPDRDAGRHRPALPHRPHAARP